MTVFNAVTRIGFLAKAALIFASFTLKPVMALSANRREAFDNSSMLCNKLCAIKGNITFNWKFPDWPATVMVVSLPITCAHTIAVASGITGFTLPGMMLLPGCNAG